MKKTPILSSILLSSILFNTGCVQENTPVPSSTSTDRTPSELEEVAVVASENSNPTTTVVKPPLPILQEKYRQMKTVQGETITVREHSRGFGFPIYKDKIVLVQIFGKECHYCFEEMPIVNRIQREYEGRLSVVGIQGQSPMTDQKAKDIILEHDMQYPIIDQDEAKSILVFLRDIYGWRGILPYILLIKNAEIEQVFKGADNSFEKISRGINDIQ